MQNVPYKKTFDKDGKLENPIDGFYISPYPNRKDRRSKVKSFNSILPSPIQRNY